MNKKCKLLADVTKIRNLVIIFHFLTGQFIYGQHGCAIKNTVSKHPFCTWKFLGNSELIKRVNEINLCKESKTTTRNKAYWACMMEHISFLLNEFDAWKRSTMQLEMNMNTNFVINKIESRIKYNLCDKI